MIGTSVWMRTVCWLDDACINAMVTWNAYQIAMMNLLKGRSSVLVR